MGIKAMYHPVMRFWDPITKLPLDGGKVYFYEPGTSDLKDTYTDSTGGTANTNPVILDARGEANIWLNGLYKVNITDVDDVQVSNYPVDNFTVEDILITTSGGEWLTTGDTPTYIGTTQFSVEGDKRTTYQVDRRVRVEVTGGTKYGVITASTFGSGITTVTVSLDSGTLDSGLSSSDVGLLSVTNSSLPEGNYTVKDASLRTHAPTTGQVQDMAFNYVDDSGAVDVYVGTLAPAITVLINGLLVALKISATNTTTTPTLNLNGLGAKTIVKQGAVLAAGDLLIDRVHVFVYNATADNYELLNPVNTTQVHDHATASAGGQVALGGIADEAVTGLGLERDGGVTLWDDFLSETITGPLETFAGTVVALTGVDNGVISVSGAGGGNITGVGQDTTLPFKLSSGTIITFEARASTNTTTSLGLYAGLWDGTIALASINDAIAFRYNTGTNKIVAHNSSGGTATDTDLDVDFSTSSYQVLKFIATPSQIDFYVDDVLKASHTTNIPATTINMGTVLAQSSVAILYYDYGFTHQDKRN